MAVTPAVRALLKQHGAIKLDVGCGEYKNLGFVGLDKRPLKGVDIVWDFEQTPWPLPANSVSLVVMMQVWEHVSPTKTLDVMAELHRVCQPEAVVMMKSPYGMGYRYQQDPTHQNPSNDATWMYWDALHPSKLWEVYRPPVFHIENYAIVPAPPGDRDFEVALRVCKPAAGESCAHEFVHGNLINTKTQPAKARLAKRGGL